MSEPTPPVGWGAPPPPDDPEATAGPQPTSAPTPQVGWQIPDPDEPPGRGEPRPDGWLPPDGREPDRTALGVVLGGCFLLVVFATVAIIVGLIFAGPRIADELRSIGERLASPVPSGTISVFDLKPGECFDEPDANAQTVDRLVVRDCAEPHGAEVVSIEEVPGGPSATFPGDDAVGRTADDACTAAFTTYVGISPEESDFDITYFTVTADGWANGDRSFDCIAIPDGESPTSGSIRGAKR